MPETDIRQATRIETGALADYKITPDSLDTAQISEFKVYNQRYAEYNGYYLDIPEYQSAINAFATWVVGQGWTAGPRTTAILEGIDGWGEDTFLSILFSCVVGKKVQGDFHTHPYLAEVRKAFGITFKASDELIRSATETFLEDRGISATTPSHADARSAVLGKCSRRTEGTTCVGSDLDFDNVECWTIKTMDDGDCIRALMEHISPEEEEHKLPKDWIKPLFETEMIRLKRG